MARRLPPLNALASFEAAARHLSFSKAAEELHVTHGAVSRAVRHLEDHLGVPLFIRSTRSVCLTSIGVTYAAEVREALDRLAAATAATMGKDAKGILAVSTLDSFAGKWLMPRLFRFRRIHGDIDVRLSTSRKLADFVSDGIDIAIRYGGGQYPGLTAELLMQEDVFPVCSPKLLEGPHPLLTPADLVHHTLIHDEFHIDWTMWLQTVGAEGIDAHRGVRFHASEHAVQAAVLGDGVVIGRSALVADDLEAGRLVRPFTFSLPARLAYYVVYPPRALQRFKVKAFRDWIFSEAVSGVAQ
jgi:LysR family transcriptional regulator, glycine cleavage system transcriptional activator